MKEVSIRCAGADSFDIEDLVPFQDDIKTMDEKALKKLKRTILDQGFSEPIAVWRNGKKNFILNGHQRHTALTALRADGFFVPPIPVSMVEADDEQSARKKILTLASQFGDFNVGKVEEFIARSQLDVDWLNENTRLANGTLKFKFDAGLVHDPNEDVVPTEVKTRTKLGDIFLLGDHRLMCGDSTSIDAVEKLMAGRKADMVFTDPPYNLGGHMNTGILSNTKGSHNSKKLGAAEWDKDFDITEVLKNLQMACAQDCVLYVCTSHFLAGQIWSQQKEWCDRIGWCVWNKPNPAPSLQNRHWTWSAELICYATRGDHVFSRNPGAHTSNVWTINVERHDTGHVAQKPVAVPEMAITHSSNIGQTILDLFGGSGSTLIACEKLKRQCFMMELDPKYCDVIIERWEKFTNRTAQKIT